MVIECSRCQAVLQVSSNQIGHTVRCPKCAAVIPCPAEDGQDRTITATTNKPTSINPRPVAPDVPALLKAKVLNQPPRNPPETPAQTFSLENSQLPAIWKRRIASELEKGEKLLWADQPDLLMATFRYLPRILAFMLILFVLLIGVGFLSWSEIRQGHLVAIFLVGALLLGFLGLPFLMVWHRYLAHKTCYALTTKRGLVFVPNFFGKLSLVSYFPEKLQRARFEPSWLFGPAAGDWVFQKVITEKITHYVNEGRIEVHRGEESFGFLMLRYGRELEPLLRAVAGN